MAIESGWLSLRFGVDKSIETADVILILDCDVPWINTRCKPNANAKIYHVDVDPLKQQMPVFYVNALARFKADSATAIKQINDYIHSTESLYQVLSSSERQERWTNLQKSYADFLHEIETQGAAPENGQVTTAFLCNQLRKTCPKDTLWCIEAVTQTLIVGDQIQAHLPGSWINCGGGGLGWSGGGKLRKLIFVIVEI
jgi:thiamine pyrophosphate-dependent acetolactate synthase large subunit-like protein